MKMKIEALAIQYHEFVFILYLLFDQTYVCFAGCWYGWRCHQLYFGEGMYTVTIPSILLWPFIVIWRAWQHVQPISFFWLVNLEAGCRLISYSFYQQIHGGDIRPYSFNLLVFLVAEGANLLFVERSKALCCGAETENLKQIQNLRHCFKFFY